MDVQHAREHIQGHSVNHELITYNSYQNNHQPHAARYKQQVQRNQQDQANNKNGLQGKDLKNANLNQSGLPSKSFLRYSLNYH